mmetsp:Transcript_45889/g.106679  ORF Transcript_45889/g.106679 Transcript_45889/m.106679 type:complete len:962 (+) Transcript_45889:56-2941(+)
MPVDKATKYGDGAPPLACSGNGPPSRNFRELIIRRDPPVTESVDRVVQQYGHYYKPLVQDPLRRRAQLIEIYGEDTPLHHEINDALTRDDYEGLFKYASYIRELRDAFNTETSAVANNLGPFEGLVYRCAVLPDPGAVVDLYERDAVFHWPAFISTTTDRSILESYGNVLFEIRCVQGIGALDEDGTFSPADIVRWSVFQDADEVLFPPYVKYRVVNIRYPTTPGDTRPVVQCEVLFMESIWAMIASCEIDKVAEWCEYNPERVRTEGSEYSLVHHAADVDLAVLVGTPRPSGGKYLHEVLVDYGAHPMEECPHTNQTVMEKAAKLPGSQLSKGGLPELTQLFVTVPEGAPPGSLLSIPVDGATGPVTAVVPEGYPAGSLLVLARREGTGQWVEDVPGEEGASATVLSEHDILEQESAALVPAQVDDGGPPTVTVRLDTSVGIIDIVVRPDWAPHGAERFLQLAASGDLDDLPFYRAVKDCLAQFGLPAKRHWPPIQDDVRKDIPFLCGAVCFAAVGPNSRKSTLFICTGDMSTWFGKQPWETPIGAVAESSLSVLDKIETCYGDIKECGGTGPEVRRINLEKNSYLHEMFPRLTYIRSARPLEWTPPHTQVMPVAPPRPALGTVNEAFHVAAMKAAHAAQVAQAADVAARMAAREAAQLQHQAMQQASMSMGPPVAPPGPPLIRYPAYQEGSSAGMPHMPDGQVHNVMPLNSTRLLAGPPSFPGGCPAGGPPQKAQPFLGGQEMCNQPLPYVNDGLRDLHEALRTAGFTKNGADMQVKPLQPAPYSFSTASESAMSTSHPGQTQPASAPGSYVPPVTNGQVVQSLSYVPPVVHQSVRSLSYVPPCSAEQQSFGLPPARPTMYPAPAPGQVPPPWPQPPPPPHLGMRPPMIGGLGPMPVGCRPPPPCSAMPPLAGCPPIGMCPSHPMIAPLWSCPPAFSHPPPALQPPMAQMPAAGSFPRA